MSPIRLNHHQPAPSRAWKQVAVTRGMLSNIAMAMRVNWLIVNPILSSRGVITPSSIHGMGVHS
jgi:hypothetical protein